MNSHQVVYLVFGLVLILALVFDLGLLSKKNKTITIRAALLQTLFWVLLAICFFSFYGCRKDKSQRSNTSVPT